MRSQEEGLVPTSTDSSLKQRFPPGFTVVLPGFPLALAVLWPFFSFPLAYQAIESLYGMLAEFDI
jgi:hypothetical protein